MHYRRAPAHTWRHAERRHLMRSSAGTCPFWRLLPAPPPPWIAVHARALHWPLRHASVHRTQRNLLRSRRAPARPSLLVTSERLLPKVGPRRWCPPRSGGRGCVFEYRYIVPPTTTCWYDDALRVRVLSLDVVALLFAQDLQDPLAQPATLPHTRRAPVGAPSVWQVCFRTVNHR
jgi:hypothetical protein